MRVEKKNSVRNSVSRLIVSVLGFIMQTIWIILLVAYLNIYSWAFALLTSLISIIFVFALYINDKMNSNMKIVWIMLILMLPIFGICLYLMYGRRGAVGFARKRSEIINAKLQSYLKQEEDVISELENIDFAVANEFRYISKYGEYPCYRNEGITFFAEAGEGLEAQKKALSNARSYIFMEYHAIEDAEAFSEVLDILKEKAAEGVEIRIIYDDMGSIGFLSSSFIRKMKRLGIQCRVFNRVLPVINIFMQNRDHRKITVIDGKVGFTGGYNLANEYFGITHPYGEWKDSGIQIEGAAVKSLLVLFLQMWNMIKDTDQTYEKFFPETTEVIRTEKRERGYVQPYGESPLSNEHLAENAYMNIIKNAKHELYLTTPYLIISSEMQRELILAAKRGIDVRIVTPGIPDKKMVYQATRSYYSLLVQNGVRVYEYKPGFCHAKQWLCDDETAIVGTINLDYRSLYHHFENAVFMYDVPIIADMKKDFERLFSESSEVTEKYKSGRSAALRFGQVLLRLIAPLL